MRPALLRRAEQTPKGVAHEIGRERVALAQLADGARALARALLARGLGRGDVLAVALWNGRAFVECFHAASLCGAVFLPLQARATAAELAFALRDAGARLLLHAGGDTGSAAREAATRAGVDTLAAPDDAGVSLGLSFEHSARAVVPPLVEAIDPASTQAVLYTSGTTGRPRGVCLRHESFAWNAAATALHLGALPSDRGLACLPLFHVGGLAQLVRSALSGSTLVVHERFDAERASEALDRFAVTGVSLVPTMLGRILDVRRDRPLPGSVRCVLLGGASAPPALLARARAAGVPVATSYGLTEATSQVATLPPGAAGSGDYAPPLPGVELRIEDEAGAALAPGSEGEICVRGPNVMSGYLGLPDESARALRGGWLHTGDVGVLDRSGWLRVLDRRSDLVVSGGENVYPAEVEAVLLEHPDVREVAVAGEPDEDLGRRVLAAVVLRPGASPAPEALREFCRGRLAGYKIPRRFAFVAELPRTGSGKILRRAIAAPEG